MGSTGWKPAGDKPEGFDGDVVGESTLKERRL